MANPSPVDHWKERKEKLVSEGWTADEADEIIRKAKAERALRAIHKECDAEETLAPEPKRKKGIFA